MPNLLITVPHSACSNPEEPDRALHKCDHDSPLAAAAFERAADNFPVDRVIIMLAPRPRDEIDFNSEAAFASSWRKQLRYKMEKHSSDSVLLDIHSFLDSDPESRDVKLLAVGSFPALLGDMLSELGEWWSIGVHSLGMSEAKKENIIFEAAMKQMPALGIKFNEDSFDEQEYEKFAEIVLRHLCTAKSQETSESSESSETSKDYSYGSEDSDSS